MKRALLRPLAITLVVGIVLGLGLLSVRWRAKSARAQVADPSRAAVIQAWLDARNQGDEDAAAATLADNAFYIGSSVVAACNLRAPCYDRASIQQSLSRVDATNTNRCYTIAEIRVAGNIVTGRIDNRSDFVRASGVEHAISAFMADVVDGKIVWIVRRFDTGDPQTALWLAISAGMAQPGTAIPNPSTPCGSGRATTKAASRRW